jgi:hypothetical protein
VLAIGALIGLGLTWLKVTKGELIHVEQTGAYWSSGLLKRQFTALPPLTAVTPKVAGANKVTEVQPIVPRLGELIADGTLVREEEGQPLMLQGFRMDTTPRYGSWPGVIAITGMQNVGKTITMVTLIIIALLQGARVIVCDTHHSKARSLFKKIEALKGLVTFAVTEEEVLKETRAFSEELSKRKGGSEPYPYIIFYDELCSLVRAKNDELREVLPTVMEEASQEGHGYGLHLVAAIHDVSNAGIGDARLRGFWNWVYCHRMEAGQSKFIEAFKGRYGKQRTSMVIAGLPAGHVMARDEVNEIEYLVMPFADSRDVLLARKKVDETRGLGAGYAPVQITRTERPYIPEQIAQHTYATHPEMNGHAPTIEALQPKPVSQNEQELQAVVTAWNEGHHSIHKNMAATGIGENRTRTLIAAAKVKGLIEE